MAAAAYPNQVIISSPTSEDPRVKELYNVLDDILDEVKLPKRLETRARRLLPISYKHSEARHG